MIPEKPPKSVPISDREALFSSNTEQNSIKGSMRYSEAPIETKPNEPNKFSIVQPIVKPPPAKESRMAYYKNEILAGIIVGFVLVPQECAYSFIANVDPSVGTHSSWINGIITAIFGGRPAMINGFTGGLASLASQSIEKDKSGKASGKGVEEFFISTIVAGVIIALCGALKLGKFQVMIPATVKVGFCNGLAIIIGNLLKISLKYEEFITFLAKGQGYAFYDQNKNFLSGAQLAIVIIYIIGNFL